MSSLGLTMSMDHMQLCDQVPPWPSAPSAPCPWSPSPRFADSLLAAVGAPSCRSPATSSMAHSSGNSTSPTGALRRDHWGVPDASANWRTATGVFARPASKSSLFTASSERASPTHDDHGGVLPPPLLTALPVVSCRVAVMEFWLVRECFTIWKAFLAAPSRSLSPKERRSDAEGHRSRSPAVSLGEEQPWDGALVQAAHRATRACFRLSHAITVKRWIFSVFKFAHSEAQLHRSTQRLEWTHLLSVIEPEDMLRAEHAAIIADLNAAHIEEVANLQQEHAAEWTRVTNAHMISISELQSKLRLVEHRQATQITQLRFQHGAELSASEMHTARLEEEVFMQQHRLDRSGRKHSAALLARGRCAAAALASGREGLLLAVMFGAWKRACDAGRAHRASEDRSAAEQLLLERAAAERQLVEQKFEGRLEQLEQSIFTWQQEQDRSLAQQTAEWQATVSRAELEHTETVIQLQLMEQRCKRLRQRLVRTATSSATAQDWNVVALLFYAWRCCLSCLLRERDVVKQHMMGQEQLERNFQSQLLQVQTLSDAKLEEARARLERLESERQLEIAESRNSVRHAQERLAYFQRWVELCRTSEAEPSCQHQIEIAETVREEAVVKAEAQSREARQASHLALRRLASTAARALATGIDRLCLCHALRAWMEWQSSAGLEKTLHAQARRAEELHEAEIARVRQGLAVRRERARAALERCASCCEEFLGAVALRAWRGLICRRGRHFRQLHSLASAAQRDRGWALLGSVYNAWCYQVQFCVVEAGHQKRLREVGEGKCDVLFRLESHIAQMEQAQHDRQKAIEHCKTRVGAALYGANHRLSLCLVFLAWAGECKRSSLEKAWRQQMRVKEEDFRMHVATVEARVLHLEQAAIAISLAKE